MSLILLGTLVENRLQVIKLFCLQVYAFSTRQVYAFVYSSQFLEVFLGEFENPEIIWNTEMR